jgi:hypothetical protein
MNLQELIPMLQVAIGPSILISGVGLLLLTMTNRLGRAIDRARHLATLLKDAGEENRRNYQAQIDILWRRARLLRTAIFLAAIGAFFAAAMMILVFVSEVTKSHLVGLISVCFLGSMASVMALHATANARGKYSSTTAKNSAGDCTVATCLRNSRAPGRPWA